jgi:hypothetical protein
MEVGERSAMRNSDNRRVFQAFGQRLVHLRLTRLVQCRSGFVQKQACGLCSKARGMTTAEESVDYSTRLTTDVEGSQSITGKSKMFSNRIARTAPGLDPGKL